MARVQSPSPPDDNHGRPASPRAPNKREKRRTAIADKLLEMVASFSDNRDDHYRAQIQAIQRDLNLIVKVDPYTNKPLDDSGEDLVEMTQHITAGRALTAPDPYVDFAAQFGRFYSHFVDEVNDALEERDVGLSILHTKYETNLHEIERLHSYRTQLAREEHKALKNTLRERLISQLNAKRTKLLRDKEQLDIADANVLLLHPNQFTTANPASPGGPQNPRKTRHTRHRVGETEELADSRRKRKAAVFDDDNGSPAPPNRTTAVDAGYGSPFRDARSKTVYAQYEAPIYSVERLFTEKELSLSRNIAEHATINFFKKPRVTRDPDADASSVLPASLTNGNGLHHANDSNPSLLDDPALAPPTDSDAMDTDNPTALSAPDMTRTASYHATRNSARHANDSFDTQSERLLRIPTDGPVFLTSSFTALINRPNAAAPHPPSLSGDDVASDLSLITREVDPGNPVIDRILTNAMTPLRTREYQYPVGRSGQTETSDVRGSGLFGSGSALPPHMDAINGPVPMSASSSMAGYSDTGGYGVASTSGRGRRAGAGANVSVTEYTPEKFLSRM